TVPDEAQPMKLIDFATAFDAQIPVLREAARKTLAADLDIPSSVVLGVEDLNHWCTVPSVEIMSSTGWKTYDQLEVGELVLTLNHETGLSEWQPLLAVNTWQVADHPMISITGKRHRSLTTARHRWPLLKGGRGSWARSRQWTTSGDLFERAKAAGEHAQRYEYLPLSAPHAELPTAAKYDDALVELVAWFFTEGSTVQRAGRGTPQVTIHQSQTVNPDNVARIRRALTALFGAESMALDKGGRYASADSVARRAKARELRATSMPIKDIADELGVSATMVHRYLKEEARTADSTPRWRAVTRQNGMVAFRLNAAAAEVVLRHAPHRVVSMDFVRDLTATQLELFIDAAIRGDGHYLGETAQTPVITQKNPRMLDAMELAAILAGYSTYRYNYTNSGRGARGPRQKTQHCLALSRRTTFAPRGRNMSQERYTGTIWCPTTPNGTWLARHEGTVFYTGNSSWSVQEDAIRAHLGPLVSRICVALTIEILWPALRAAGDTSNSLCIWWSAQEITQRPDRSVVALAAHKQGLVSDKATRRELGFDEEDAPDDGQGQGNGEGEDMPDESGGQPEPGATPNPPKKPAPGEEKPAASTRRATPARRAAAKQLTPA
ncbi:MAG TPA: hypothetical protein VHH34_10630, partial [Pseudonocardiaceae bacterium]|nr:hypothetical protein [Pseudonocardiaceae bacterium]